MVSRARPARGSRLAEVLTGVFLFIATATFVLWQNAQLTVLWDLSYILENADRIALGQIPYRDFPFPYAPLTFLVQATIIRLFGRVVLHHYLYAALTAALASLLSWRIVLRLLAGSRLPVRRMAFLLSVPLIFIGTSSILPYPFYDSDCTLFILFCIWLLLRLESAEFPPLLTFGSGLLLAVPLFIKQNTGLAFLLSAVVCIAWLARRHRRSAALLLGGAASGFVLALGLIQCTAGLANYYHWTIQFAASRRLPGLATMLDVYSDPALLWSYVAFAAGVVLFRLGRVARWIAVVLLSLPFLWAVAALFLKEDVSDRVEALLHLWPVLLAASLFFALAGLVRATTLAQLVPLMLLGAIHGAFLSQQLWGSTYALWPLLMILIATILAALCDGVPQDGSGPPLTVFASVVSLALLITGGYYATSHERLEFADLSGETLVHSRLPALRGLAERGDWLPDFEELVAYSEREIPRADAILMLPGEDLFYFTTGRTPQFPVVMVDNTVNPFSAEQIARLARQHNVRWLIVKRRLQLQEEPIAFRQQLFELLARDFVPAESLNNYDIYRRRPN
jgi:4-amino-4-deoxy-L-arabinose transferase-like glycosyltransferase